MNSVRIFCGVVFYFIVLIASAQPAPVVDKPEGAPVILQRDTLFHLFNPLGAFSKEERAAAVSRKIALLEEEPFFMADSIKVVESSFSTDIIYKGRVLMSITDADAA